MSRAFFSCYKTFIQQPPSDKKTLIMESLSFEYPQRDLLLAITSPGNPFRFLVENEAVLTRDLVREHLHHNPLFKEMQRYFDINTETIGWTPLTNKYLQETDMATYMESIKVNEEIKNRERMKKKADVNLSNHVGSSDTSALSEKQKAQLRKLSQFGSIKAFSGFPVTDNQDDLVV